MHAGFSVTQKQLSVSAPHEPFTSNIQDVENAAIQHAVTVRRVLANSTVGLNADTVAAGMLGWAHECLTVLHYAPHTQ